MSEYEKLCKMKIGDMNEGELYVFAQGLLDEVWKFEDENEKLKSIIKEAIEYIQDRYDGEVLTHTFDKDNVKELLDILKGSDKE